MNAFPSITQSSDSALKHCIESLGEIVFLGKETRTNHTAIYPMHNRFFSNGDRPWVILVNFKNTMKLTYGDKEYTIHENELVCFDDNIPHAWEMNGNDMTIYYYRAKSAVPVTQGTYCIDELSFS
ncbi:hypothetical protein [Legionella feeleii]|uniref:AraC-type arabinose-binding/dimerisation domain-containing protein n=1 Tax=Legionella feeleii TaxID=453 RepID=A0A378IQH8_9GAMM|nr:hypothetical protein [Legionella feeleii]STX37488.1 Uncharacterised protein [Legionella feeleii]